MRTLSRSVLIIFASLTMLLLSACGSSPATIAELPMYPGASELKPGESVIGDTLAQNGQQDAAMREAMGLGGSTEQRGFSLPADADWAAVESFYNEQLKAAGWTEGMGGMGGAMASQMLEQANQGNELFQTAMYTKGKQVLSVIRLASPIDPNTAELILSLSTQ
ncbi:MAG: hypothetical protein HC822_20905 [Oscillochloris sp.]|nr:hypothetical protein [Oscillochloris sp.]